MGKEYRPLLPVALLACLFLGGDAQAGPFGLKRSASDPPGYSPLHYWAPALYRIRAHKTPDRSQYLSDLYPSVPATVHIIRYPTPAVDPAHLYLNSGLPYDPARPVMVTPSPRPAP